MKSKKRKLDGKERNMKKTRQKQNMKISKAREEERGIRRVLRRMKDQKEGEKRRIQIDTSQY